MPYLVRWSGSRHASGLTIGGIGVSLILSFADFVQVGGRPGSYRKLWSPAVKIVVHHIGLRGGTVIRGAAVRRT